METMSTSFPAKQERLALLCAGIGRIGPSLDVDQALREVVDASVQLTGAERGSVLLVDAETGRLDLRAGPHIDGRSTEGEGVEIRWAVAREVLERDEPVLIRDAEQDPDLASQGSVIDGSLRSIVCVPLRARGGVMGVLCVDNPAGGGVFAPEDLVTLSALANPAAMAIENARLHQAVEAATEAKAAFVSVVSHELRVPMTSIKGYADMLRQGVAGPLNDLQGSFVDTIRRNVDRMGALVSDLSEMNSIESGRLVLRTEPLDLAGSVSEAIAVLQAQFDEKQQRVAVELAADLEPVHGDRSRVVEILTRLLSNASKYSPAGRPIVVRAERIQDGGRAWMRLQVVDHGYGISREDQSRLFSPFFRSDDPDVRHETGWGLGLSIAKMLVEAQSGRVTVESEPNLGSNFGFTLPVAME